MSSTRSRPTRRGRNSNSASPKRREKEIIAVAAEIFRKNGYADTSVQDVADAVGILKGSLYYYIDSKEDLLYRVLLEVHEDAHGWLEEISEMKDASPLEKISAYVRRHVEYNVRNMNKVAVYYHDFALLSPDRRANIRKERRTYEDFLEQLIKEAQRVGEVDPESDPRVLAYCLFGTMNWTYTWYRPSGRVSVPKLCDMLAGFAVQGLAQPPHTNGSAPRRRTSAGKRAARKPASQKTPG